MSDINPDQPFQKEQHKGRVRYGSGVAVAVTLATLLLLMARQPFTLPNLATPAARLAFAARVETLLFAWLGVAIAHVARLRFF